MSLNTPSRVIEIAESAAENKLGMPSGKLIVAGILAGIYIAMGGTLSLIIGYGFPEITAANPAMQRLLSGMMFPLGLILVVFAGAELFTGNNAVLIPGLMNRRYGIGAVLRNWTVVYLCNFIGALFFAYVMVYQAGLLSDVWRDSLDGGIQSVDTLDKCIFERGRGELVRLPCRMARIRISKCRRQDNRTVVSCNVLCRTRL